LTEKIFGMVYVFGGVKKYLADKNTKKAIASDFL